MNANNTIKPRMDKWLWAVRIFKTRSMAANACKKGRVTIDGMAVKPSYLVKTGETVEVKMPPITRTFSVTGLVEKRLSAALAANYVEETTPPQVFETLRLARINTPEIRDRGAGRPTKKERRALERLKDVDGE